MSHTTELVRSGVVLFTTPGCPHCPRVRDLSERAALDTPDVEYMEVSALDRPDLAVSLKIRGAPTALAFDGGVEVDRLVGAANAGEIDRVFASAAGQLLATVPRVSTENRQIRTGAGLALVVAGLLTQVFWLVLIGALFGLSAWHDLLLPRRRAAS